MGELSMLDYINKVTDEVRAKLVDMYNERGTGYIKLLVGEWETYDNDVASNIYMDILTGKDLVWKRCKECGCLMDSNHEKDICEDCEADREGGLNQ